MPSDRSLRSSHPFLPYSSYSSRPSSPPHQPHQSRVAVVSTSDIQPSQYGLHQPSNWDPEHSISDPPPQNQINCLHPTHVVPQPHSATASVTIPPPFPPLSARSYPAISEPVNLAHRPSYHPTLWHPQAERGTEPGTQLCPSPPSLFDGKHNHMLPLSSIHNPYLKEWSIPSLPTQHNDRISPSYGMLPCADTSVTHGQESVYPAQSNHQYHLRQSLTSQQPPMRFYAQLQPQVENERSQQPANLGMFNQAHSFSLAGNVLIDNNADNFTLNNIQASDDKFMKVFLQSTMIGAEFDSSDRNPPPRCHPGTRLEIIQRCQAFIFTCVGCKKLRWVVGAAGVGKSAIMQSIAEDKSNVLPDNVVEATVFFAINRFHDATKTITTIAYQIAVKLKPYRLFIQGEVARDPSLLRKSLSTQYKKLIIEPFMDQRMLDPSSRVLIILDGLDECDDPLAQQELLGLIANFCITYPTSPIVWIVASRPEPHITSFFSQPKFALTYEKEEILVVSDQAREDVERYLRDELKGIQLKSISLKDLSQWPSEDDFLQIAKAADGLFAYASTVVRYISDPNYGDPVSQLEDVLEVIKTGKKEAVPGKDHPMARLDALYAHIMSKIPTDTMVNTRRLLLLCLDEYWGDASLQFHCNMLQMTRHTAYGATHHLYSIATIPGPTEAAKSHLQFFHKSFEDYLKDFERSRFSPDITSELQQLRCQCALRVIEEVPEGFNFDGLANDFFDGGIFKNGRGTGDSISLSWPVAERFGEPHGRQMRLDMYRESVWEVMSGFRRREEAFQSMPCIQLLTSCFVEPPCDFPNTTLRDIAFDVTRRSELLEHGILKLVPLGTLEYDKIPIPSSVRLSFRSSTTKCPNPWTTSCKHQRRGKWEDYDQDWSTEFKTPVERFYRTGLHYSTWELQQCGYCFERFTQHFKTSSPGHLVTVLDVTPGWCWVEFRFVDDDDDGASEWTYHFGYGEGEMNVY